jgi:hypothetical protein
MAALGNRPALTHPGRLADPWLDAFAVTPNDAADLAVGARGLYAAGAGNVAVLMYDATDDAQVQTFAFAAGEIKPLVVRRVMATNTTATGIKGGC